MTGEVEVTEAEYKAEFPDKPIGAFGKEADWRKPVKSDSISVVPKRIKEAEALCVKHGVPTDFSTNRGRPVFKNRAHKKAVMKVFGWIDKHSYTGY